MSGKIILKKKKIYWVKYENLGQVLTLSFQFISSGHTVHERSCLAVYRSHVIPV